MSEIISDISESLVDREDVLSPICHCWFSFRTRNNREVLSPQPLRYKLRVDNMKKLRVDSKSWNASSSGGRKRLKRLMVATACVAISSVSAFAADLPAQVQLPAPVVPAFSWTGFYLG